MQPVRRFLLVLALTLCVGAATAPTTARRTAPPGVRQPNIILITLDTTRADRMGFLGSTRGLTPNLDSLAKQSVVFTRAYAQVPLTAPSHASLLSGTYPQFNQLEDATGTLNKEVPYLPDVLHGHGYRTAAFLGASILDRSTAPGFDRGFDVYDAPFHPRRPEEDRYHSEERRAEDVASQALNWLSRHQQGPFFLWLHFFDAHDPYDPPPAFKTRYAAAPYDGEIAYTDSVVGDFLAVLKRRRLFENALIAIAADHGEAFGEHGEERHGMFLYDETIHVPLLLKLPAAKFAGKRTGARVALADIAPCLLQVAGVAVPPTMQGQSLLPLVDAPKPADGGHASSGDRAIFSETDYPRRTFGWAELHSWRTGRYLYVRAPKRELYDESVDPRALKNLAPAAKAVADTLDSQLSAFLQQTSTIESERPKLDPEQAEKLAALGYLAVDSPGVNRDENTEADPKDKIEAANKFLRALVNQEEDRYEEAIADLRDVVRMEPDMGSGYLELGRALVHHKEYEEALPILRKAAEKMQDSGLVHYELGFALVKNGQWDAALPEMQAAVLHSPDSALVHFYLAAIYTRLRHLPEATAEYENALKIDPKHFQANLTYGRLLLLEEHPDAALPKLSQAVKVDPKSPEAHRALADAYQQLGQTANAAREREKAARLAPHPATE